MGCSNQLTAAAEEDTRLCCDGGTRTDPARWRTLPMANLHRVSISPRANPQTLEPHLPTNSPRP